MISSLFYLIFLIPICVLSNWFMFSCCFFFFFFFFFFCFFFFFFFFFLSFNCLLSFFTLVSYSVGLDKLSFVFCCLSIWICLLMVLSVFYDNSFYYFGLYMFYLNFLIFFLIILFLVSNFFFFYFFFECSLIPVFLIIFGWGNQPERLKAGFFLIFYTLFGSLPFLLVILFVNFTFGGFNYFLVSYFDNNFLMFFMVFSFMVKFPLFGVHLWLPSAHVEAPVSGSMILAGVLLKLGGYGFIRSLVFLYNFIYDYGYIFISLSLLGCLYISLFCLIQSDLKILVAYSSVCHMGVVISGLFTMMGWGILGSIIFMLGHGFVSSGLFFLIGIVYNRFSSRSFFILKGLLSIYPSLSMFWFFFCCLNMSCPPSINLFSEICLIMSLLAWSSKVFFFVFVILFLSACYSLTIFFMTQHGSYTGLLKYINSCSVIEYLILFLHLYPVIFLMFDLFFFF
nr:NADH dehydrogenase subunit 4 [Acanalonia sp.]